MKNALIAMLAVAMVFAAANIYACPNHDKAQGQANAANAGSNMDKDNCSYSGASSSQQASASCPYSEGTGVKATVAKGTDKVQAIQLNSQISKKNVASYLKPASFKPAPGNDSVRDAKSVNPVNKKDMASVSQNN